jgi:hypothetical protein
MSAKRSSSSAISKRKCTSYNLDVKLDICCKQRGEHTIDTACALQIPQMMIHTKVFPCKEVLQRANKKKLLIGEM